MSQSGGDYQQVADWSVFVRPVRCSQVIRCPLNPTGWLVQATIGNGVIDISDGDGAIGW